MSITQILLILNFIVPFVMILAGSILKKHPVYDMSNHNGYNTPASRKTQKHWNYAQSIAPNIFIRFGKRLAVVEVIISALFLFTDFNIQISIAIGMIIGVIFLIIAFLQTEQQIKSKFDI